MIESPRACRQAKILTWQSEIIAGGTGLVTPVDRRYLWRCPPSFPTSRGYPSWITVNLGATGAQGLASLPRHDDLRLEEMARMGARRGGGAALHQARPRCSASTSSTPPTSIRSASARRSLGRALKHFGVARDQVVVATKVFNPMGEDPNQRGLSRKHIMHAIDDSLRRLGMDYVDLYQIHRFDPTTPIEETLEALTDVVKAGKALYIGASSMYAWQFAKMLDTSDRLGLTRFVTMQNHYNLIYREEEREMIPLCLRRGHRPHPVEPARARLPRRQPPPPGQGRDDAGADRRLRPQHVLPRRRLRRRRPGQRDRGEARRAECAGGARLAARPARRSPRRSSARAR